MMPAKEVIHPCRECGEPATMVAQDVIPADRISPRDNTGDVRKMVPFGDPKYGCDEHPVESYRL